MYPSALAITKLQYSDRFVHILKNCEGEFYFLKGKNHLFLIFSFKKEGIISFSLLLILKWYFLCLYYRHFYHLSIDFSYFAFFYFVRRAWETGCLLHTYMISYL
jgi:hypothetical protein